MCIVGYIKNIYTISVGQEMHFHCIWYDSKTYKCALLIVVNFPTTYTYVHSTQIKIQCRLICM